MSLGFVDSDNDSENIDIPDNMEATSINTSPTAKRLKVNDDNEDIIHEAVQIKNDEILAIELQQRLEEEAANDMMEESELENSKREGKHDGTIEEFTDQTSIIEHIEKKTDNSNQFFIVMRRKVSFNRVLSLWQREARNHHLHRNLQFATLVKTALILVHFPENFLQTAWTICA